MSSLQYLWNNRARFPFFSQGFFKAWAKRFLTFAELNKRNRCRKRLINQGANISNTAEIGNVKVDGPSERLSIGNLSFIGEVYLALYDEIEIGKRVCINDGAKILTGSHDVFDSNWCHIKKKVIIEDYVWIGMNAIVLPGVSIGHGAVVGAGAVVTRSVAPGAIVVGNPAKPIEKKRTETLNYNPCEFLAANKAWLIG